MAAVLPPSSGTRKRKIAEAAPSQVLLRARPGDTSGVHVRSEILRIVSPVLDGVLRDAASTGSGVDGVDGAVITLECTAAELEAFVACISMTEGGSPSSGLADDDDLSISLLKQGACAMRCLDKYDASGVMSTLDLVAKCLVKAKLPDAAATHALTEYLYARLSTLPGETLADAVSESVYNFLAANLAGRLATVRRFPVRAGDSASLPRPLRDAALALHASLQMALVPERVPPKVLAEILMRAMVPSWPGLAAASKPKSAVVLTVSESGSEDDEDDSSSDSE